ncbi:hypothetical protein JQK88_33720 [Mesorhizobium caraganae]|uniref:hypothetical protein n=1 Tax=Mesorhizobium caraganae TaxID=483206 RepID=UPI001786A42C|nr:hypothetical protein [Mesorhizobium caraganae]MBM2716044.1 hypothetical protein [Mesorhizobium caraganae]
MPTNVGADVADDDDDADHAVADAAYSARDHADNHVDHDCNLNRESETHQQPVTMRPRAKRHSHGDAIQK